MKIAEIDERAWSELVETQPGVIQKLCRDLPPNKLYMLKTCTERVTIHSYFNDGTLSVNVTNEYNSVPFNRRVFGVRPEDLEECDFTGQNEVLCALITGSNHVKLHIDALKKMV